MSESSKYYSTKLKSTRGMSRRDVTNYLKRMEGITSEIVENKKRDKIAKEKKLRLKEGRPNPGEVKTKEDLGRYIKRGLMDENLSKATRRSAVEATKAFAQNQVMKSMTGEANSKPFKPKTMSGGVGFSSLVRLLSPVGAFARMMRPKEAGRGSSYFGPGSK